MFGHAWLKVTSPPEAFEAEDAASQVLGTRRLSVGAESPATASRPMGQWVCGGVGVQAWRKHSMVTVKRLLKRQISEWFG